MERFQAADTADTAGSARLVDATRVDIARPVRPYFCLHGLCRPAPVLPVRPDVACWLNLERLSAGAGTEVIGLAEKDEFISGRGVANLHVADRVFMRRTGSLSLHIASRCLVAE